MPHDRCGHLFVKFPGWMFAALIPGLIRVRVVNYRSIRVRVAVIRVRVAETGRGVGLSIVDWRSPPKLNMYHSVSVTAV